MRRCSLMAWRPGWMPCCHPHALMYWMTTGPACATTSPSARQRLHYNCWKPTMPRGCSSAARSPPLCRSTSCWTCCTSSSARCLSSSTLAVRAAAVASLTTWLSTCSTGPPTSSSAGLCHMTARAWWTAVQPSTPRPRQVCSLCLTSWVGSPVPHLTPPPTGWRCWLRSWCTCTPTSRRSCTCAASWSSAGRRTPYRRAPGCCSCCMRCWRPFLTRRSSVWWRC
mmetsp:Transcript_13798/g.29778  ORF Transcript_13798/g.29778 Transcript_13798/m.29778 type:complete len:224 (+) Transcript_13798:587-1258(+)